MPKDESLPTRKKMRKGTHSCFECRRRKIRCIYQSDNPDICSECFARGSRCIDQENANPEIVVDHRKNLRERVSRLEALVDSLLEEKTVKSESPSQTPSQPPSQAETSSPKVPSVWSRDTYPPTPLSSEASSNFLHNSQRMTSNADRHHIPILSVFEDALNGAEEKIKASMGPPNKFPTDSRPANAAEVRYTVTNTHPEDIVNSNSSANSAKREKVKQALLSVLPPYDQLLKLLNSNGDWWQTWRRKCSGTSGPNQSLSDFAVQALTTNNIGAIATVVIAVGICVSDDSNDVDRYIECVDRWVLSDDEYASTLEGIECLILKSKWYADVGQPRRAWLSYRKGLMYAQLIGLHRKRTTSAAHESIWWALYHGDRFVSLLLGLPYGIMDVHCDLTVPDPGGEYLHPLIFFTKISQLAGKVIDRNQGVAEQSFAWALQLDQELEDVWKKVDPSWLEYSELLADADSNAAELREKIMAQIIFHQIRVYLHLPFMLKSATNSRFTYSRTTCINGSREVLRLYQALRTGTVQPLYECKAVDFIGFTAAVLVLIGLFNFATPDSKTDLKEVESDIRLIEISIDIFRRASSEKGGKVALQSAEVLEKMQAKFKTGGCSGNSNRPGSEDDDGCDMVIPYFGTISIRRGGQVLKEQQLPLPPACSSASSRSNSTSQNIFTPTSEKTNTTDFFSAPSLPSKQHSQQQVPLTSFPTLPDPSPFIAYDGFYNYPNLTADPTAPASATNPATQVNDDSMSNFPLPTNNFSWQQMPMDIDQDWSWFLNDGTTQGVGGGAGAGAGAATMPMDGAGMDAFAQGFTGFG